MNDQSFFYPGDGNGVLLIHGLTGTPVEMKFVGKGLARLGYTVSGVQLAGHCGTVEDLLATRWQDWYASVVQAHAELAAQVDRVFVAGLSMGALLGLHLAACQPEAVAGLALYAPTLWYDGWNVPWVRRLQFLLPLMIRLGQGARQFLESDPYGIKDERLRARVVANMQAGNSAAAGLAGLPWGGLLELRRLVRVVIGELPRIATPILILHPAQDDVASPRNAEFIARHLAGPVEKVFLHDCYHMITVDRERDRVVALSAQHFRQLQHAELAQAKLNGKLHHRHLGEDLAIQVQT